MSSPNFQAGRIHKQAFVVSTAVFLGFCILSVASRFCINLRLHKQFSIDDAFLVIALCCLTCALAIMYSTTIDKLYLSQALSFDLADAKIPLDYVEQIYSYHKWATISLMLTWGAVMAVKFSFLFLFRKLIDRIRSLVIYWWFVTAFSIVTLGYGLSVYYLVCPYYDDARTLQCTSPSGTARTMRLSAAQTTLDLLADLLILYIPIKIIWKIQIKWTQKVVLAFSLCLTIVMILVTIIRVSGIKYDGMVDQVWGFYFLILSAEIGIILTAVTAFRTFFVSRQRNHDNAVAARSMRNRTTTDWYAERVYLRKRVLSLNLWRSTSGGRSTTSEGHFPMGDLPYTPRAHVRGGRVFVDERADMSGVVEGDDDMIPLHEHVQGMESRV